MMVMTMRVITMMVITIMAMMVMIMTNLVINCRWQITNTSKNAKDYHILSTCTFRKLYIQKFKRLVACPRMILDYSQSSVSKSAIELYFNCGILVGA